MIRLIKQTEMSLRIYVESRDQDLIPFDLKPTDTF